MNKSEQKHSNHNHSDHMNHNHADHSHHDKEHSGHKDPVNHDHSNHVDHSHHDHKHNTHIEQANHNHDHDNHMDHSHHGSLFKKKFLVSLFFGIPILILSPMMGVNLPFQFNFPGSDWLVAILATVLFFYGGSPFVSGAKSELKKGVPGMMMLITLGISVAYFYSIYAFVMTTVLVSGVHIMDFFWELASLILIMLLGHWIEMEAVTNAGNALQKMAELLPSNAWRVDHTNNIQEISLTEVQLGDILLVKAGEKIPTDGLVIEGQTLVNESLITGEAKAVSKESGSKVIGGSVNGNGTIKIHVTGTGESGYLAQVMDLVSKASSDKSRVESLADIVAKWLFYVAVVVGVLALIIWSILSNFSTGIERSVAVFVIACPHALGLAIPLVTARSTSIGAQNGLLIKSRHALEVAQKIDIVMMDKTGTLTEGNFSVTDYRSFNNQYTKEEILKYMASLEQSSSHPLAIGILEKAKSQDISLFNAENVNTIAGVGLEGYVNDRHVKITSVSYLEKNQVPFDKDEFIKLANLGYSISFVFIDDVMSGLIAQGDEIKSDSKGFIASLKKQGIQPVMLTGDNKQAATMIAKLLDIEDFHAELLPEDKERIVNEYKERGKKVIMVGDGVNDAPSLVRADVGIAIGAGTDIAVESADVILVKSNPSDILHFISLAKNTTRKMKQNLLWGAGYNFITIPLAAGILAKFGIILSPAVGAIIMSTSTVFVAINAMLLKIDK